MEQENICDSMLRDAHSLLDRAEELAAQNKELRKREQDLLEQIKNAGGFKLSTPSWIEYDDTDPEKLFTLNEVKNFKVLDIDKEGRKISLSLEK